MLIESYDISKPTTPPKVRFLKIYKYCNICGHFAVDYAYRREYMRFNGTEIELNTFMTVNILFCIIFILPLL